MVWIILETIAGVLENRFDQQEEYVVEANRQVSSLKQDSAWAKANRGKIDVK